MTQPPILIVPGRGNSAPGHWQSFVENTLPNTRRVQQTNWDSPTLEEWSRNIDHAVRDLDHRPLVVAHSYGCLALAHAQISLETPIGAALFVAPADPERFGLPLAEFTRPIRQPALVIASENDPWLSLEKAIFLADEWGTDCLNLGQAGHINIASGFGRWFFGEALINSMRNQLAGLATISVCRAAPGVTNHSFDHHR